MKTSETGIELIKEHEGCRLKAYLCPAGKATIGYGHTATARMGQRITEARAEELLQEDVAAVDKDLNALLKLYGVELTQNQYDALASFVFNLGISNLRGSTLFRRIRQSPDHPDIAAQWRRWVYAGGKQLPGLERRREAEIKLYLTKQALSTE